MRQFISHSSATVHSNAQSPDRAYAQQPPPTSRAVTASAGTRSAVQRSASRAERGEAERAERDERAEIAAFPASLLPDLPEPLSIWLAIEGAPVPVQLTTSVLTSPQQSLAAAIVFDAEELRALVAGIEADRIWRKELLAICFDKWRRPEYRLTRDDALAGANPDPGHWSLERVLARVGAVLARVEHGGQRGEERHHDPLAAAA
jgi:hypothetical protein